MAKLDPAVAAHLEWMGFVQPTGLVVSAPALVRAGALLERSDLEGQRLLRAALAERHLRPGAEPLPWLVDFPAFARSVLGWSFRSQDYAGTAERPIPPELVLPLPEVGDTLRPTFAVREPDPAEGGSGWQLLVSVLPPDEDFDRVAHGPGQLEASPHGRLERLLRHTRVPAGLLVNGQALRLLSAPQGESSGWLDFKVADMAQTGGRPISTALRLLLSQNRLLALPKAKRLAALLDESRKFQNEVSEKLARQVLHALYELLRGFQAANDASKGELLREVLAEHPDQVYRALLTVLLRLVFLLYAEERDMLPKQETFLRYYSLSGLYERLREDAAQHPDTMEQRFGAWAQLLVLFRLIHDGAETPELHLPKRHGVLFDPDRYKFLEGRAGSGGRQIHERIEPPRVPDGTIYRALEKLLVLDGERLSYRALDVEQIGSVYETMMGFRLEKAIGPSVAIKAQKKHGAPTAVDLEALLDEPAAGREKWLGERTGRKIPEGVKRAVKAASSLEDLHAALLPVIDSAATPDIAPPGAMVLQPSEERRKSGSHYTPRALTEPIVRTTLAPILERLRGPEGQPPRPEQILDLKVCDPAMGSGAFLVEACRQLGAALVEAWRTHAEMPVIPPDEREEIYAMRLVAQRCLYGVDRNPVAVDLAKVSLWLATLAKDHALTFVDHALRHGDSLVGLSRRQLEAFHWEEGQPTLEGLGIREPLARVRELRARIRGAGENVPDWELRHDWDEAQFELGKVRLFGDLVLAAFFEGQNARAREQKRMGYRSLVLAGKAEEERERLEEWRQAEQPLVPFHWEVEFPEVFERENPGFDALVGNPPFLGGKKISTNLSDEYRDWLAALHEESSSNADLVAHFLRRAFNMLRRQGALGLIATNTIAQGDTRSSGLRWICLHGGEIYCARKRVQWPGLAAVVVSMVHVERALEAGPKLLDKRKVDDITAFLFHRGGHADPAALSENAGKSFVGSYVLGMGFTFDDSDTSGVTTPLAEMRRLLTSDARNQDAIFPYIGGDEVNTSPTHEHHRYVINFNDLTEEECRRRWPGLMAIVEAKVKPERTRTKADGTFALREPLPTRWWQYADKRPALQTAVAALERALCCTLHSKDLSFTFLLARSVFSHALAVFPLPSSAAFCALQSRPHETWARFFGSSMKDDLRYTPSDCFETFPFPTNWQTHPALEAAGQTYYDFRAALMVRNNEGLTKTYNRFHDPLETSPDIGQLRDLHAAMDRAVLDAYGWHDIPTDCQFLLDYEIDEEEWGDKKKPYRYRWPDDVRDEVLARLLELNAQRAKEEESSGAKAAVKAEGRKGKGRGRKATAKPSTPTLFDLS